MAVLFREGISCSARQRTWLPIQEGAPHELRPEEILLEHQGFKTRIEERPFKQFNEMRPTRVPPLKVD